MGYLPCISFDWERLEGPQTIHEKLSYKEAQQCAKRLEEAQKVAYINLEKAQKLIKQQANKHKHELDFTVGNIVQVIIKNQKTERLSCKLDYKMAGLYKIINKVGNLYKVELPDLIKVYLIFLLDKLWKVINNLLPRQKNKPPLLIQVNRDNKQEVDEILACKLVYKMLKYCI